MTATAAPLAVKGLIDSSGLLNDTGALKRVLAEEGYLYLRGSGPRAEILELRRQILEICREAGWLDANAPLMEGRWSGVGPFTESEPVYMAVYKRMLNLPLFNGLPASRFYMDLFERVLAGKVFNHKMHIGRVSFPNNVAQTTPAHQDFHYIGGSADTYTVWTPIGDIPLSVGGLAVLAKSHKKGFLTHKIFPEHKYAGSGMDEGMIRESLGGLDWHTGDFTAGDVLMFHSHTIHKAMPNVSGDLLRLSCDNRYQLDGTVTGPAAHRTHHNL